MHTNGSFSRFSGRKIQGSVTVAAPPPLIISGSKIKPTARREADGSESSIPDRTNEQTKPQRPKKITSEEGEGSKNRKREKTLVYGE
jgi:hypothetical protein